MEEAPGVDFFRTFVGDSDLENLTLPRTYVAKSEVGPVSSKNTHVSESTRSDPLDVFRQQFQIIGD